MRKFSNIALLKHSSKNLIPKRTGLYELFESQMTFEQQQRFIDTEISACGLHCPTSITNHGLERPYFGKSIMYVDAGIDCEV